MAEKEWDHCHPRSQKNGVPDRLFTDENPATTIKGTGFKDRKTAERTIVLTSQKGARYKQYWTIKAMRERALFHPHQSNGMRDAIEVFDKWLEEEEKKPALTEQERKERQLEWEQYWRLSNSSANDHSYGKSPSKEDLKRARNNLKSGKDCLWRALELSQQKKKVESSEIKIPMAEFTALFGGPGLHGYGMHQLDSRESLILINGIGGLRELLGSSQSRRLCGSELKLIKLFYNRVTHSVRVDVEYSKNQATILDMWTDESESKEAEEVRSWTCEVCTFHHVGKAKQLYLACEVCSSARRIEKKQLRTSSAASSSSQLTNTPKHNITPQSASTAAWGSLQPPSDRDIQGPRKRFKALSAPPPQLEYLLVMDLEWTANEKSKMHPIAEITQLPSVLMKVVDKKSEPSNIPSGKDSQIELPLDLTTSCTTKDIKGVDAYAISAFDTFVRPTLNPILTQFSIDLTAITQKDVDTAPTINIAIQNYMNWLKSLDLVDSNGFRKGNWCFATWGDADIMSTLRQEMEFKLLKLPPCFDRWINLKNDSVFKKHYGREPKGGLRACVESVGAIWHGRAHNGLIDSFNTAKIVRDMVQTGFRFTRPTRGLDKRGVPYGQKNKQE